MSTRIGDELARAGAVLVRQRRHQIWRLPNGRIVVLSKTPSDWRAEQKQIHDVRRVAAGGPVGN